MFEPNFAEQFKGTRDITTFISYISFNGDHLHDVMAAEEGLKAD